MEALSARYNFVNCTLVPAVQLKFSKLGGNNGGTWISLGSYHNYALGSLIWAGVR